MILSIFRAVRHVSKTIYSNERFIDTRARLYYLLFDTGIVPARTYYTSVAPPRTLLLPTGVLHVRSATIAARQTARRCNFVFRTIMRRRSYAISAAAYRPIPIFESDETAARLAARSSRVSDFETTSAYVSRAGRSKMPFRPLPTP